MKAGAAMAGAGAVLGALFSLGCGLFHRAPAPPPVVILQQPAIILQEPQASGAPPPPMAPVPDHGTMPTLATLGTPPPTTPPPPVKTAAKHATDTTTPAKTPEHTAAAATGDSEPAPQLTPALSAAEQARERRDITAELAQAQRDLAVLGRRALAGDAAATRAQATEYVRQSRDALQQGDVVRAGNLAQKAQTLIKFLLGNRL